MLCAVQSETVGRCVCVLCVVQSETVGWYVCVVCSGE